MRQPYLEVITDIYPTVALLGFKEEYDAKGSDDFMVVTNSPTCNCQLATLGFVNYLLDRRASKKEVQLLLKEFYEYNYKNIILIDVRENKVEDFKKLFKPFTIEIQVNPYKNTNGSNMAIMLLYLDVNKILNRK